MKRSLYLFVFLISCSYQPKIYHFKVCNVVNYSLYDYKILKKEVLSNNTYKAHVFLHFPDSVLKTYDLIACSAIDICKKESIREGYFYNREDCLPADQNTTENIAKYNIRDFYDCYIGSIMINWSVDWKAKLAPNDFKFLSTPVKVKF